MVCATLNVKSKETKKIEGSDNVAQILKKKNTARTLREPKSKPNDIRR